MNSITICNTYNNINIYRNKLKKKKRLSEYVFNKPHTNESMMNQIKLSKRIVFKGQDSKINQINENIITPSKINKRKVFVPHKKMKITRRTSEPAIQLRSLLEIETDFEIGPRTRQCRCHHCRRKRYGLEYIFKSKKPKFPNVLQSPIKIKYDPVKASSDTNIILIKKSAIQSSKKSKMEKNTDFNNSNLRMMDYLTERKGNEYRTY